MEVVVTAAMGNAGTGTVEVLSKSQKARRRLRRRQEVWEVELGGRPAHHS